MGVLYVDPAVGPYQRPHDQILLWAFFVPNLFLAEIGICYMPQEPRQGDYERTREGGADPARRWCTPALVLFGSLFMAFVTLGLRGPVFSEPDRIGKQPDYAHYLHARKGCAWHQLEQRIQVHVVDPLEGTKFAEGSALLLDERGDASGKAPAVKVEEHSSEWCLRPADGPDGAASWLMFRLGPIAMPAGRWIHTTHWHPINSSPDVAAFLRGRFVTSFLHEAFPDRSSQTEGSSELLHHIHLHHIMWHSKLPTWEQQCDGPNGRLDASVAQCEKWPLQLDSLWGNQGDSMCSLIERAAHPTEPDDVCLLTSLPLGFGYKLLESDDVCATSRHLLRVKMDDMRLANQSLPVDDVFIEVSMRVLTAPKIQMREVTWIKRA